MTARTYTEATFLEQNTRERIALLIFDWSSPSKPATQTQTRLKFQATAGISTYGFRKQQSTTSKQQPQDQQQKRDRIEGKATARLK